MRKAPRRVGLTPAGGGAAAVVGLAAAGLPLAAFRLGHGQKGTRPVDWTIRVVEVRAVGPSGWVSGPLAVARSRSQRFRGLRPRAYGMGLVLKARSVHGLGMQEALGVVSLSASGTVRRRRVLLPGRVFWDPGGVWMLEVPSERGLPPPGATLVPVPILGGCPEP
jgi:hypothetical protein